MNQPTPEEFAAAPLFRSMLEERAVDAVDASASEVLVEGMLLGRSDAAEGDGFVFTLEGVEIGRGSSVEAPDSFGIPSARVFRVTYLDLERAPVVEFSRGDAVAAFVEVVREAVRVRHGDLARFLSDHGVRLGEAFFGVELDGEGVNALSEWSDGPVYGPVVRIVRSGTKVWIEGDDRERPWAAVRDRLFRCDEAGEVLVSCDLPITSQIFAIDRVGETPVRHREDLKAIRRALGDLALIDDTDLRYGVHMFDLIDSDSADAVVDQKQLEAARSRGVAEAVLFGQGDLPIFANGTCPLIEGPQAAERDAPAVPAAAPDDPSAVVARQAVRPLGDIMADETGYRRMADAFLEIRAVPTYMLEQIRAVGRELLAPFLGDFPMERVIFGQVPRHDPEMHVAFMEFVRDGEKVRDVAPMTHPSMPGYKTSPGVVNRRDGWDLLTFSDAKGSYCYAWPTDPKHVVRAEPVEDEAPRLGL